MKTYHGFLSYSHFDDKNDKGYISQLRSHICDEVRAKTGVEIDIFQDKLHLQLGENWKDTLKNNLNNVYFLIPIITPSYLKSQNCIDELVIFLEREKSFNDEKLIFPIIYIPYDLMNIDNDIGLLVDELTKRQYLDWSNVRKKPFSDPKVQDCLETISFRIAKLIKTANLNCDSSKFTENISSHDSDYLEYIEKSLKHYKSHLPEETIPRILISGTIGNGKTTSINTLFGKEVGAIGHDGLGTTSDASYNWQYKDNNIQLIDVPGLGESQSTDRKYIKIYKKWIGNVHGFIIIICPPRPAADGTLKTVKTLIENGVLSSQIIFGYNKIRWLNYNTKSGKVACITFNDSQGVTNPLDKAAIFEAKKRFINDLNKKIKNVQFHIHQVVEFDAITGWNLYKLLEAVVQVLPYRVLKKLDKATKEIRKKLIENEKDAKAKKKLIDQERKFARNLSNKIIEGIDNFLFEINHTLWAKFRKKKSHLKERVTNVIDSGGSFIKSLKSLFK